MYLHQYETTAAVYSVQPCRVGPRPEETLTYLPLPAPDLFLIDDSERLLAPRTLVCGSRLFALNLDVELLVSRQPRPGRDETAHDHVLLETAKVVGLAADRRFGEHLGRFLEARRGDERLGGQRGLGDAEEQRLGDARAQATFEDFLVLPLEEV